MAARAIVSKRATMPAAAGLLATSTLLIPQGTIYAEAPESGPSVMRKPIYDEPAPKSEAPPSKDSSSKPPPSPTPTSRLANEIGRARHFLAAHVGIAEDRFNAAMSSALSMEESFTSTIASLAPAPETREKVLPGALYVLVAAMAGSIVARNRNILLRATMPVATGVGAGWVLLPHTSRNVADLVWKYEERVPVVAENHLRIRRAAEQAWKEARDRGKGFGVWADERVKDGREAVEGWVRKGR